MAGIYLHIPFCKKRCIYCDFYSTTDSDKRSLYVEALKKELETRKDYLGNDAVETIYFGGGTPSQLKPSEVGSLITHIKSLFATTDDMEITIEANPDDIDDSYLQELCKTDVNRISIGIQSFDDKRLQFLNRRHNSRQAITAVERCRRHGLKNISIDLIYGFPDETMDAWCEDIDRAIALDVDHISAYHIIYEEGTPLHRLLKQHAICELDEDASLGQFKQLKSTLEKAGYIHYEISNFCKPGRHSRHNTAYWQDKKYLGCGPSAHSYDLTSRRWNVSDLSIYMDKVRNGGTYSTEEKLDLATKYNEYVMLSLRTMWGLRLDTISSRFGKRFLDFFMKNAQRHIDDGCLCIDNGNVRLTTKGIFVSDGVMSDLMFVE